MKDRTRATDGRDVDIAEALFVHLLGVENLKFQRRVGDAVEVSFSQLERPGGPALYFQAEWRAAGEAVGWESVALTVYLRRLNRPSLNLSDGQARQIEVLVHRPSGGRRRELNTVRLSLSPAGLNEATGRFPLAYPGLAVYLPQREEAWTARARAWAAASGLVVRDGQVELGAFDVEEMELAPSAEDFLQNLLLTALLRAHFHARLTLPGVPQPTVAAYERRGPSRRWTRYVVAEAPAPPPAAERVPCIATLQRYFAARGLYYPADLLAAYFLSLQTKPFVLLTGLSGTGKTKLAQGFADFLTGGNPEQQAFLAVRPDWLDPRGLLGYFNPLTGTYQATGLVQLLLRAEVNWRLGARAPFFVLLDEMNLAPVEYYFADFLSVLESRRRDAAGRWRQEALRLHDHAACVAVQPYPRRAREEPFLCHDYDPEPEGACARHPHCPFRREVSGQPFLFIPPRLEIRPHVYFTGTVNVDETTHAFSPKVLDRANAIEFQEVDLADYFAAAAGGEPPSEAERAAVVGVFTRDGAFYEPPSRTDLLAESLAPYRQQLADLQALLEPFDLHFGYRVANEILHFLGHAKALLDRETVEVESGGERRPFTLDDAFDRQLSQKLLPKFHGPASQLEEPLRALLDFCQEGEPESRTLRYPRSARKIERMLRALRTQGFASFA